MTQTDEAVHTIVTELRQRFGIATTLDVLRCVRASVSDLDGSTTREALPEMAVRLVLVRLLSAPETAAAG